VRHVVGSLDTERSFQAGPRSPKPADATAKAMHLLCSPRSRFRPDVPFRSQRKNFRRAIHVSSFGPIRTMRSCVTARWPQPVS